ncbi:E3 ubiquitin-protein ligase SHPRH [Agrilus planipennis]|uniref:E3 ubiquitin-protein ligase SHPRH n=1 Tax=Agrilus planipennis TaxID=224129 RepID=A0A1W4WDN3_AGRPL|nr:E3 ubiquitin-protein ligase SHPRH [Agrilus planipennis]
MGRTKRTPKKISGGVSENDNPYKKNIKTTSNRVVLYNNVGANREYYLGEIWLGKTDNTIPKKWRACRIEYDLDLLKLEFDFSTFVVINLTTDMNYIKGLIRSKTYIVRLIQRADLVFADLYFSELPFSIFTPVIENITRTTFALLYDIELNNKDLLNGEKSTSAGDIKDFYKELKQFKKQPENSEIDVQHPALAPKLRLYQQEAVRWMLSREQFKKTSKKGYKLDLNPLYKEVTLKSGETVYLNKSNCYVENTPQLIPPLRTGGILADEMGLGKTVEVLACILLNPYNENDATSASSTRVCIESFSQSNAPQTRKRRKPLQNAISEKEQLYVDKPKKLKVPKDWVKNPKKKSNNYIALHTWYESVLNDMKIKKPEAVLIKKVQCICGNRNEDNIIQCVDCSKFQHVSCFNYKPEFGDYRCAQCWENQPYIECKGTIIVCPKALVNQWLTEISKHIDKGLKVFHYDKRPIYPTQLKEYDIVLTTYSVLHTEFWTTEVGESAVLRRTPRYSPPGSPITRMNWWRVCLDEAQTVELPSNKVSEMALKLHGVHRWAVTGTPICKDISDLYGLISYMQFEPFDDKAAWDYLLYLPYLSGNKQPMYEFLSKILWRTAKNDVLDQINIPKQTVEVYSSEFSAVERYFYKREHELSAKDFLDKLRTYDLNIPICSLPDGHLKHIIGPLLSIRQSCTHPNAVRGRYLATKKQVASMNDLLEALIYKNNVESEEHLRIAISAINGIAGIYLLLNNPEQAVEEYRKVLQLAARFNGESQKTEGSTIDKLQLIHTMHNLADVLDMKPNVAPTLRDSTLRNDCRALQEKFIDKYIKETISALKDSASATESVVRLQEKQTLVEGDWYSVLLDWISVNEYSDELNKRIMTTLENADLNKFSEFSNERKILYRVTRWSQDVMNLRDETMSLLEMMYTYSKENNKLTLAQGLVEYAAGCHLKSQKKSGKRESKSKCLVCDVDSKMRDYESKLFNTTKLDDPDKSNKGNWKPTVFELVLKALLLLGKAKKADKELLQNGHFFCSQIDNMKKEFKELRRFWTYLDRLICAQDEVDMCKIRLRLKDPSNDQSKPKTSKVDRIIKQLSMTTDNKLETIHMLDPHELDYQRAVLEGEANQELQELEKSLGTRSYLETLRRDQESSAGPDPCPICKTTLEEHKSVLPCGHCYCLDCIQILLEQTSAKKISCSICRQKHKIEDISYIKSGSAVKDLDLVKIKGNYSTKIEAVVKLVVKLKAEDSSVKILVFSSWPAILKIIQNAFKENDVTCDLFSTQCNMNQLAKFKDPNQNLTVLLLPIKLGSKGLNIIEATHVFFVEPLLNPGDELQAVGRVHRIGQTRPTFVHKFYIKNTIEENIYLSTSTCTEKWVKNKVTLKELHDLFTVSDNAKSENENEQDENPPDDNMDASGSSTGLDDESSSSTLTNEVKEEGYSITDSTNPHQSCRNARLDSIESDSGFVEMKMKTE